MTRLPLILALAIFGCRTAAPTAAPTTLAASATRPVLAARLDAILGRLAPTGASVAARVVDLDGGDELFARDADRPMTPASNMKLLTAAAALNAFGPDATFETDLMVAGDDLYLVGHGDPATGDAAIAAARGVDPMGFADAWADELIARGRTRFAGRLYYVDAAFEARQVHPSWEADDLLLWYAAPVAGLNLNGNCIDVRVTPSATPGGRPALEVTPRTSASVVIVNDATSDVAAGDAQTVDWSRLADRNLYTVAGTVARPTTLKPKPVIDPAAFCADAVRTRLAARGISIAGPTLRASAPPSADGERLAPAVTRLVDVLWRMGKDSRNLAADGTAKLLGRAHARRTSGDADAVGSWANAEVATRAYLARRGIDARGLVCADGSGLSRENRVTARLLTEVLVAEARGPDFETFRASLSVAGVDGTMRGRLPDVSGRAWCKSGSMRGVRALSGYARTDAGRWRAFAIVCNVDPDAGPDATHAFQAAQEDAVRAMLAE